MKDFVLMIFVSAFMLNTPTASGQYYFYNENYYSGDIMLEAGISLVVMNCFTDIGGRKGIGKNFIKDLNWRVTRPGIGIYATATYKDVAGLRIEATLGSIASYDHLLKKTDPDLTGRYGRNLGFKSRIRDFQLAIEIYPLSSTLLNKNTSPFWSPYFIAGIGYFFFDPMANLEGHWYKLHSLRLEGQGFGEYPTQKRYSLNQLNIPLGAGLRYEVGPRFYLRIEIIHRILFTDYLDDVSTTYIDPKLFDKYLSPADASIAKKLYNRMQELQPGYNMTTGMQRGDPVDNDAFFTIQFKIGWVFRKKMN